jgi:glycosyltransferase involved in cell wall biosynthesis
MTRLSLICPTIGRTTLLVLSETVIPELVYGVDEFIVVADGPIPEQAETLLKELATRHPGMVRFIQLETRVGDFGCTPCDVGIEAAKGDAVFFIGDDDRVVPGAFAAIRKAVDEFPNVPHLFSMQHQLGLLGNSLACCSVSSQQLVVPRDMSRMPKMSDVSKDDWPISDWVFIDKVHRAWDATTMFHPEVIAILEAQHHGAFL